MKIRILVQPTGLLNGKPWPVPGEVIDVPDVVAVDLLNARAAEAVKGGAVEKATPDKSAVETATPKAAAGPRRKR